MCTVSFLARPHGYALIMNRDEQLTRVAGHPPQLRKEAGRSVLSPTEPGGGTWIALNDSGVTLALINWYSVKSRVTKDAVSRGRVVAAASAADQKGSVVATLAELPLARMNPFRLIGIFPATHEIFEWRWNRKQLVQKKHPWKARQWISSGFDEPQAVRVRSATFRQALTQRSAGSLEWLRRLHRSHAPACGAFSTCMHRADAATVSCTEISLALGEATMRHQNGAPCRTVQTVKHRLRLRA